MCTRSVTGGYMTTVASAVPNTTQGGDTEQKGGGDLIEVHCDYISADKPIKRKFAPSTPLADVKEWAKGEFVPNPPSDKTYYLSDDKTRHRFTPDEERLTLEQLGYKNEAKLRLHEEQVAGEGSTLLSHESSAAAR
jgi:hypothetical protein